MALLEFVFESGTHFFGTLLLLCVILWGLTDIARALRGRS